MPRNPIAAPSFKFAPVVKPKVLEPKVLEPKAQETESTKVQNRKERNKHSAAKSRANRKAQYEEMAQTIAALRLENAALTVQVNSLLGNAQWVPCDMDYQAAVPIDYQATLPLTELQATTIEPINDFEF